MVTRNTMPPKQDEPETFVPEGGELEPAGGIVKVPPSPTAPSGDDAPAEGDRR
jgi:hypothetical protein